MHTLPPKQAPPLRDSRYSHSAHVPAVWPARRAARRPRWREREAAAAARALAGAACHLSFSLCLRRSPRVDTL